MDDISFIISELSQTDKNDISSIDPHSVSKFTSNGAHSFGLTIKAIGFNSTLTKES